ncbi:macrolide family glycosyltransferase [Streptosporangium sp. DT93]|uniref:macrolide family glycosyltransferase n=1 Tax=Streptosporangium sp. DT93 TaxID=3393428 RepID=UPI003CFAEC88
MSLPDRGHLFPHLAVVRELVNRGNRVTFVTAPSMTDLVAASGARMLPYESHYEGIDDKVGVANDDGGSGMMTLGVAECASMLRAIESDFGDDRPDLVVYDFAVSPGGRVLERKWGLPAIQVYPVFAQNEHYSFADSLMETAEERHAGDEPPDLDDWMSSPEMREWVRAVEDLLAAHGVDTDFQELMLPVQDLTMVYVPREFQPYGETFDERFEFVGPCMQDRTFLGTWEPPKTDLPVVLVSMGTVFNELPDFFRTAVRAFTGAPLHVVMTVGGGFDPADLGPLPDNIEVHRWVSHLGVLEHARAFVTHAGMSSVTDALSAGCPVVAVPVSPMERSTGRRVAQLGIGRLLLPDALDAGSLRETVLEVVADEATHKNAAEMRAHTAAAGGTGRAADVIENRRGH